MLVVIFEKIWCFCFFSLHCGFSLIKQFISHFYNSFWLERKIIISRIKPFYLPFTVSYLVFFNNISGGFWKDLIFFCSFFNLLWFLPIGAVDLFFYNSFCLEVKNIKQKNQIYLPFTIKYWLDIFWVILVEVFEKIWFFFRFFSLRCGFSLS